MYLCVRVYRVPCTWNATKVQYHRVDQLAAIATSATSNNQRELPMKALPLYLYQVTRFTLYLYPNISQLVQYCML